MLEGHYSGAALGLHYWPWESRRAWGEVRRQFGVLEVLACDPRVRLARYARDFEAAAQEGQLALCAGLEGAHLLGGDLGHLDEAEARGALYMTLAHFSKNSAVTPSLGRGRDEESGLTAWGRALIKRLNEKKILVDVAHVNGRGVLEACDLSEAPILATHSCVRSLYDTPRGLTDEGIRAIAQSGGVIGVIFAPIFLAGRLRASLDRIVDHLFYIADLVGWEHTALGSDLDGWIPSIPHEMRDCRDLYKVVLRLFERGADAQAIRGMLGENILRVIRQARGA
jgi:membrane dipeptidase